MITEAVDRHLNTWVVVIKPVADEQGVDGIPPLDYKFSAIFSKTVNTKPLDFCTTPAPSASENTTQNPLTFTLLQPER